MNAELITTLESALSLLDDAEQQSSSNTVCYEVKTARIYVQRAIEWERSVGKQEEGKP